MSSSEEIVIDETNFNEYFFPVKNNRPQRGQVLARFSAVAELVNGFPKDEILNLLRHNPVGGKLVPQVLRNVCHATEKSSIKTAIEIATNMSGGMSDAEVLNKPYQFELEICYWTQKEYVPQKNPYWETVKILNEVENIVRIEI